MGPLIVVLSSLLIIIMVIIKIMHSKIAKRHSFGFKSQHITYFLRISSYQWFVIRRVILFSLCVLAIFWYLTFRYFPLFANGVNKGWLFGIGRLAGDDTQNAYNNGWGMLLFLDLCSLFGLVTPLVIIFDRKDKWSLAFANLGILGACMTFYGGYSVIEVPWSFSYLLFGTWDSVSDLPVSFLIHMWMLGFSMYTFLWRRKWVWQDWIKTCVVGFGYMFYVLIAASIFDITSQVTGLGYNDYVPIIPGDHTAYQDVILSFGLPNDMWILAAFGLWGFFAGIAIIILPGLHILAHRYTDVVENNNYAKFYQTYPTNAFIRWLTAYSYHTYNQN